MIVSSSLWNLVSLINMNSHHLRKNEVEYELKIRGVSHVGNANDLRKRLNECYSSNTSVSDEAVEQLDSEEEIEVCEEKLEDLDGLVSEYDGSYKDNEYNRILARLWHLSLRVGRIPVEDEPVDNRHTELKENTKTLLEGFIAQGEAAKGTPGKNLKKAEEKEIPATQNDDSYCTSASTTAAPMGSTSSTVSTTAGAASLSTSSVFTGPIITPTVTSSTSTMFSTSSATSVQTTTTPSFTASQPTNSMTPQLGVAADGIAATGSTFRMDTSRHHVPVFKWGLQFNCNLNQSVGSFLQRVEELRRARGVSEEELFQSAVDLFQGTALIWYRSTLGRIKSWRELCKELRTVFQSPDYDIRLQREIMNRFQGQDEPIDLYIASMEGLFGRLTTQVGEDVRLRQLMDNMNPHLQDRLAMEEIRTIEELRSRGRRAESGRLRAAFVKEPTVNRQVLEPDLAYHERKKRGSPPVGNVASLETPRTERLTTKGGRKCWNCGEEGHVFSRCQKERKRFCYACGQPDVIKAKCGRCNPKNV